MSGKTNIERVREWCARSLDGEVPCCLMVRKAIERWQADLERPDLYNASTDRNLCLYRQYQESP